MLNREFEKQVQDKMEELQFTPSAPVWTNIEKVIRKKKDRRRILFWLPLVALGLGGGTWWALQDTPASPMAVTAREKAQPPVNQGSGNVPAEMEPSGKIITTPAEQPTAAPGTFNFSPK